METKDIVVSIRKSVELPEDRSFLSMLDFTDKVAEISFRAGIGIVEEWIKAKSYNEYNHNYCKYLYDHKVFRLDEWQAQLKEWGIK